MIVPSECSRASGGRLPRTLKELKKKVGLSAEVGLEVPKSDSRHVNDLKLTSDAVAEEVRALRAMTDPDLFAHRVECRPREKS